MTGEYVAIGKASEITGLSQPTLRKLADSGKLKCYVTDTGKRRFHVDSLTDIFAEDTTKRMNFIYARSEEKESLIQQIEFLQKKRDGYTCVSDISSGVDFNREGLSIIVDACLKGTIGEVVVVNKDRISTTNAFDLMNVLVTKAGGEITIIENEKLASTTEEVSRDFLSIIKELS